MKHQMKNPSLYKALFVMLSSLLSFSVYAQSETGNGGDVVLCDHDTKAYMLDYIEGLGRGFKFTALSPSASVEDYVQLYFGRLQRIRDARAWEFESMKNAILSDLKNWNGGEEALNQIVFTHEILPDITDSQELGLPQNCRNKAQLVIQRATSTFPEDQVRIRNFKVNIGLWNLLDAQQKALAILHEILYWDAINSGAVNSRPVRYMLQHLASEKFDTYDWCAWSELIKIMSPIQAKFKIPSELAPLLNSNEKDVQIRECDKNGIVHINLGLHKLYKVSFFNAEKELFTTPYNPKTEGFLQNEQRLWLEATISGKTLEFATVARFEPIRLLQTPVEPINPKEFRGYDLAAIKIEPIVSNPLTSQTLLGHATLPVLKLASDRELPIKPIFFRTAFRSFSFEEIPEGMFPVFPEASIQSKRCRYYFAVPLQNRTDWIAQGKPPIPTYCHLVHKKYSFSSIKERDARVSIEINMSEKSLIIRTID
jgi:hypothetical protein